MGIHPEQLQHYEDVSLHGRALVAQAQAVARERVDLYDAIGGCNLESEQTYDWFMSNLVANSRASAGFARVHYVRFENLATAEKAVEQLDEADVLSDLESERKGKRHLAQTRITKTLELSRLYDEIVLGDPGVEMLEYEMDPESIWLPNAEDRAEDVKGFLSNWHRFLYENGIED